MNIIELKNAINSFLENGGSENTEVRIGAPPTNVSFGTHSADFGRVVFFNKESTDFFILKISADKKFLPTEVIEKINS